jgi:thiamine-monophosphate kinase
VNLREFGEAALIRKIREKFQTREYVTIGIGDDAAVFDLPAGYSAVFCSDLVAENAHFTRDLHPPDSIGYKAVAVNVSDVGAMGGMPMHFLISLALPGDLDVAWVDGFLAGVERACADLGVSLLGGDSSSSDRIFVDVSMIGRVPTGRAVRRSGAQAGDNIYVTGALGGSALGFELLRAGNTSDAAVKRHLYPQPRHRVGAAVRDRAHAMIDVSDGLSTDLGHILDESRVSARIYKNKIPVFPGAHDAHVLHGGEEYELIITAPDLPGEIEGVPVARIGEVTASKLDHQLFLIDGAAGESILSPKGWQHFS